MATVVPFLLSSDKAATLLVQVTVPPEAKAVPGFTEDTFTVAVAVPWQPELLVAVTV